MRNVAAVRNFVVRNCWPGECGYMVTGFQPGFSGSWHRYTGIPGIAGHARFSCNRNVDFCCVQNRHTEISAAKPQLL